MKKRIIVILALAALLMGGGCQQNFKGQLIESDAAAIKQMFDDGQTFFMYAGTSDCESCRKYKVVLQQLIDNYEITVYYLPADDYESAEIKDLIYNYLYKLEWTPTSYLVKDGKAVDLKEGPLEYEELVSWLQDNDYLPHE